ncbi:ABC transporter permease [Saccharibacillus kuerlensis]|uniref:ABC transporter permease protein YxdM n=1 Tax=Saccharibacillus kuerlensis TaxID=459527 RepID=A0ABQ2L561_9BACL|nr:ABC transporter permease [Saccharibacillus kuerlensis]GGO03019.1 ABC transporter permease protein YxdM [Saccharibacillus kuerlensis]
MNFPRFAYNNVKRNARAYFAYFLSSAFMVMIFFSFAVFIFHPAIQDTEMHAMTRAGMKAAEYVIFVFAFFFVLYSISVFLKSRNKEFGLLLMLGAKPSQLNRLVFLENMIIGAGAIFGGIGVGLLLSKLFLLLASRVTDTEELPFYWPVRAALLTTGAFALLFLSISVLTLLFVRKRNILELIQGSAKPKKEPKASILLALFGIALLTVGWMALQRESIDPLALFVAAGAGIAGTYFFYSQLSVLFMRIIKRNRAFVWRRTNLLWVSELAYKIKDNARILFLITVVTSIASMSVGFVLSINQETRALYADNPYAFELSVSEKDDLEADKQAVDNFVSERGFDNYKAEEVREMYVYLQGDGAEQIGILIPASDYTKVFSTWETPAFEAGGGNAETLLLVPDGSTWRDRPSAGGKAALLGTESSFTVSDTAGGKTFTAVSYAPVLVVTDEAFEAVKKQLGEETHASTHVYYTVPGWGESDTLDSSSKEALIGSEMQSWWTSDQGSGDRPISGSMSVRSASYMNFKQQVSVLGFIGVFVALMFSLSSASFLYFKLHSELTRDSQMYHSLSKTGLSIGEMKKSATLQIALLFFIPIAVSAIQTFVVLNPILKLMSISNVTVPVLTTTAAFLAAQAFYFFIVRNRYLNRLKKVMV